MFLNSYKNVFECMQECIRIHTKMLQAKSRRADRQFLNSCKNVFEFIPRNLSACSQTIFEFVNFKKQTEWAISKDIMTKWMWIIFSNASIYSVTASGAQWVILACKFALGLLTYDGHRHGHGHGHGVFILATPFKGKWTTIILAHWVPFFFLF